MFYGDVVCHKGDRDYLCGKKPNDGGCLWQIGTLKRVNDLNRHKCSSKLKFTND